jgi:hypothetical protein
MNDTECVGDGSYIVTEGGAVHGLYIPSSAESGLKLNRGFTLPIGGSADFVAEFDLMKSVHAPKGLDPDYIMRPTIRLMDRTVTIVGYGLWYAIEGAPASICVNNIILLVGWSMLVAFVV